ncbi:MAG: sulfatase-like hydrolase/transferase [Bacteroidetes bacterium]|nr:sulfatase-like hydrolase/transferase [Bacteroidota bacterium]
MKPPDFLIIMTDQFHPGCLGYAGHPLVKTPHIDKLAAGGTIFDRMYTTCPLCMPARASLFTGQSPRAHSVRSNGIPLKRGIPTFTEALRLSGYRTHNAGKLHLTPGGLTKRLEAVSISPELWPEAWNYWLDGTLQSFPERYFGFETSDFMGGCAHSTYGPYVNWLQENHPEAYKLFINRSVLSPSTPAEKLFNRNSYKWALPAKAHPASWVTEKSIDFLKQNSGKTDPFFLVTSIQEPHPPFAPPAEYINLYCPSEVPSPVPEPADWDKLPPHLERIRHKPVVSTGNLAQPMDATDPYARECIAHYLGLIELVDDQVGRLMKALELSGERENTCVIFLADHGESLGDHGFWGKGPYHYDSVIRIPFIINWPGVTPEGGLCSTPVSLLDIAPTILNAASVSPLEGPVPTEPEAPDTFPVLPGRDLREFWTSDKPEDRAVLVEMDDDYLKLKLRTLVTARWRMTRYGNKEYGELYNLLEDPKEQINLWDDPDFCGVKSDLTARLLDEIIRTDSVLPRLMTRA